MLLQKIIVKNYIILIQHLKIIKNEYSFLFFFLIMKRKYNQEDNDEIELDKVDLNELNEYITKWFNDKNIKIIDN